MVHSHLLYDIVIWGKTYDNHFKKLYILQNKAVKIVAGEQWQDHVTPFYHLLQILKLKSLYGYEVAKLIHKNSWKKLPSRLKFHLIPVGAILTKTTSLATKLQNTKITKKFSVSRSQNLELGTT